MYNWSTYEKKLKARGGEETYQLWRMEQMINYGLQGERLESRLLKKYWRKLYMDEPTRNYLGFLIWHKVKKS